MRAAITLVGPDPADIVDASAQTIHIFFPSAHKVIVVGHCDITFAGYDATQLISIAALGRARHIGNHAFGPLGGGVFALHFDQ